MLRDHFKELEVSEEQWQWLRGKLRVKVGEHDVRYRIYQNEKINKCKLKKLPSSFLTEEVLRSKEFQ